MPDIPHGHTGYHDLSAVEVQKAVDDFIVFSVLPVFYFPDCTSKRGKVNEALSFE